MMAIGQALPDYQCFSGTVWCPVMFSDPMLLYLEVCKFVLFESHKNKERN